MRGCYGASLGLLGFGSVSGFSGGGFWYISLSQREDFKLTSLFGPYEFPSWLRNREDVFLAVLGAKAIGRA